MPDTGFQVFRTIFSSSCKLRSELVKLKKNVEPTKIKGVIYKITCNCGYTYIGETGRTLETRIKEHRGHFTEIAKNDGVVVHANKTMHDINWIETEILHVEQNCYKRKVLETVQIKHLKTNH